MVRRKSRLHEESVDKLTSDVEVLQVHLEHQLVLEHQHLPRQVLDLPQPPLPIVLDLPERKLFPLSNELVVRSRDDAADSIPTELGRRTKERFCWRRSDDSKEGGVGDDLSRREFVLPMIEEFGFGVEEEDVGVDGELTEKSLVNRRVGGKAKARSVVSPSPRLRTTS